MRTILFYLFSFISILSACNMIITKNTVKSVLSLILTFISTSIIWLLLESEYLALVLILLYVGAVMVLFLFVVMMLNNDEIEKKNSRTLKEYIIAFFSGIIIFFIFFYGLNLKNNFDNYLLFSSMKNTKNINETFSLGYLLFTKYLYTFEIIGLILLVSMIIAITLTLQKNIHNKKITNQEKIKANPMNRIRIIKMKSEKNRS